MKRSWRLAALMLPLSLMLTGWARVASGQTPVVTAERTLGQIGSDLYELRDDGQRSLIIVGRDGIAVVDPLNVVTARWLKADLAKRFPGRPVKYVIYSGVDFDRVAGAWVFDDTAEVIARESFAERAAGARRELPPRVAPLDKNRNGSIERTEIESPVLAAAMDRLDVKKTGALAASQFWGDVLSPDSEFKSRRSVDLGGVSFELVYAGPAWGTDRTVVYFPAQRVVFASKHAPLATPLSDRTVRAAAVAQWTGTLVKLEFDTLLDGGSGSTTRADVVAADRYVRTLLESVSREADRGRSVADIQSGTVVERFAGTPFAQQRDADIAAVFRRRAGLSIDVFGAGLVHYLGEDRQYCTGGYVCEFRRPMGPGFAAGAGFSVGRIRIRTEWATGPERSLTFSSLPYYRITENDRDTSIAALGGVRTGVPEGFNVVWLAGTAFVTHRNAGTTATSVTSLSQSSSTLSSSALAFTFGTDVSVPVTSRVALVVPVRFTTRPDTLRDPFSKGLDMRVGAGLSLSLFRKPL